MVETLLEVMSWLLVPMGLLPVITALVLLPQVNSRSLALRERSRVQILLGLLGLSVLILAANRVFNLGFELGWVLVGFVVILLLIDLASAYWLWLYVSGRFKDDYDRED